MGQDLTRAEVCRSVLEGEGVRTTISALPTACPALRELLRRGLGVDGGGASSQSWGVLEPGEATDPT